MTLERYKMEPKWATKHIADLIRQSKNIVVFTGAGISTESGLPDFRSNGGLWDGQDPMTIAHRSAMKKDPLKFAEFYANRLKEAQSHSPNAGHDILAKWEADGIVKGIATQNIDGYHQIAGSKTVWELHGNMDLHCSYCLTPYSPQVYKEGKFFCIEPSEDSTPSHPLICNEVIRPNVVLFGEQLPTQVFYNATKAFKSADLCIVLGSSCSVYPAAELPFHTVENGGKVVIINHTETGMDLHADYIINDLTISEALKKIDRLL